MIRLGAVRLLATLAATGTSAASVSPVAAQAVAELGSRSLSAAVEEVRRSPFHARRAAPSTEALGTPPGAPVLAVGRPAALAGAPASDTTVEPANLSKVFLASSGAAAVSHYLGLVLASVPWPPYQAMGGAAAIVLPALGAGFAGAPGGAALEGSLVGLAAGIGTGAAVSHMVGEHHKLVTFLAASSLAQAGIITLFTWWG